MAKDKFEVKKVIDIVGTLDKDEQGNYKIFVDGDEYLLETILEDMLGTSIQFKSTLEGA